MPELRVSAERWKGQSASVTSPSELKCDPVPAWQGAWCSLGIAHRTSRAAGKLCNPRTVFKCALPPTGGLGMKLGKHFPAAAAMTLTILASPAHSSHKPKHLDNNLVAFCNPIGISVSLSKQAAPAVNLSQKAIENTVESRIRAARLFSRSANQSLSVGISIFRMAFNVRVKLSRMAKHTGFGYYGWVTVWDADILGVHGNDGQYIVGHLT